MAARAALPRRLSVWTAAGLLSAAPVLLVSGPASAHNYLVSSTPAAGATLTELPDRFDITTNEALLDLGGNTNAFALQVTDAGGRFYGDGCVDVTGPSMSTAAALGAPGTYTVQWQVVSADGHSVSDAFTFEWAPSSPSPETESAGSAAPPACGESAEAGDAAGAVEDAAAGGGADASGSADTGAGADTGSAASGADAAASSRGGFTDALWIVAAAVAVAGAGGVVLLARTRGGRDRAKP